MRYSKAVLTFEGKARSHPDEDELEEFVFGRLEGGALDRLEEHLLLCDSCRKRLSETENFVASTRAASRKMLGAPPPMPKNRRFSAPAFALAGAFAVLLLGVSYSLTSGFPSSQTIVLVAERSETQTRALAGRPIDFQLNVGGLESIRWLEIVNANGALLHSAVVTAQGGIVMHHTSAFPSGQVWIRLYAEHSPNRATLPLREFYLRVQ